MKSFIFPSFRTVTTFAFVSLMVIGGNIDRIDLTRSHIKLGELAFAIPQNNLIAQVIQGNSGGPVKSGNCGFIAKSPNYSLNLPQRVDYMRITVQATGGQPTLLVVGPQTNDSFCVLGDRGSGLQPEISGVWEPGTYNIFIGDRTGTRHQFKLNISRSK
ncbi:MAG: hypothetical protein AAGA80_15060 [Cyanobacteria bacterium P01_F01_bin.143]